MEYTLHPLKLLWKYVSTLFRESRFAVWTTVLGFVFLALTLALPLWRLIPYLEAQYIPLHYNIYVGVDRFGPWQHLLFIPGLGLGLLLLNIVLEAYFLKREPLLMKIFAVSTVFAEIILFASMVFIVLRNI